MKTKTVVMVVGALILVLSAIFFYSNVDLGFNKEKRGVELSEINNPILVADPTGVQDEASLDTVFGGEESEDNFDDIVL